MNSTTKISERQAEIRSEHLTLTLTRKSAYDWEESVETHAPITTGWGDWLTVMSDELVELHKAASVFKSETEGELLRRLLCDVS